MSDLTKFIIFATLGVQMLYIVEQKQQIDALRKAILLICE